MDHTWNRLDRDLPAHTCVMCMCDTVSKLCMILNIAKVPMID